MGKKWELLADGMARTDGPDYVRGDVVEIEDTRLSDALEEAGSIVEVGTLEKIEKEKEQAEKDAAKREADARDLADEDAHRNVAHATDRLATEPDTVARRAERHTASSDGPRTTKNPGNKAG